MRPRWPTRREWALRVAYVACRALVRSLVLAAVLEIYVAVKGVS